MTDSRQGLGDRIEDLDDDPSELSKKQAWIELLGLEGSSAAGERFDENSKWHRQWVAAHPATPDNMSDDEVRETIRALNAADREQEADK